MAYLNDYRLAILSYLKNDRWVAVACVEQRDESNTAELKERVNTCTLGKIVTTVNKINRTVSVNGLLTTDAIEELRALQDVETQFKVNSGATRDEYFTAVITDVNFGHPVGDDSTFTMNMNVNGNFETTGGEPFKILVEVSGDNKFHFKPLTGLDYDYDVDWGDSNEDLGVTGAKTHTYGSAGTYTITINGKFPSPNFNESTTKSALKEVLQFGSQEWETMKNAFKDCTDLSSFGTDAPDLRAVTNMDGMFNGATIFNDDLSGWCVTNIPSEPTNFSTGSALSAPNKPVWGTCP